MCSACDASTPMKISSAVASTAPCVIFMNSHKERVPITVNRHTDVQQIYQHAGLSTSRIPIRITGTGTPLFGGTGVVGVGSKKYVHTVLQQWDAAL